MTVERIEAFWQPATADDVAETMKTGKPIPARVRNEDVDLWRDDTFLQGWINGNWAAINAYWTQCQVYREPSWHANRPDPGPGWVLLGKFPDEELKPGDQAWNLWDDKQWSESENANSGGHQVFGVWYRRRIEPVEPKTVRLDEGSKCPVQGCSGALRVRPVKDCSCHIKPPCAHCEDNPPCCEACEWTAGDPIEPVEPDLRPILADWQCREGDTYRHPNGLAFTITAKGFEVTQ